MKELRSYQDGDWDIGLVPLWEALLFSEEGEEHKHYNRSRRDLYRNGYNDRLQNGQPMKMEAMADFFGNKTDFSEKFRGIDFFEEDTACFEEESEWLGKMAQDEFHFRGFRAPESNHSEILFWSDPNFNPEDAIHPIHHEDWKGYLKKKRAKGKRR